MSDGPIFSSLTGKNAPCDCYLDGEYVGPGQRYWVWFGYPSIAACYQATGWDPITEPACETSCWSPFISGECDLRV